MLSWKYVVMVLNFSKNDPTTRRVPENKLFFISFGKFSDKNSMLESLVAIFYVYRLHPVTL